MAFNAVLGEIAEIVMGQSPKGEDCNDIGVGLPLLNGPTEFTTRSPNPVQYTNAGKKFSSSGDILFCVRGSTTGRMNYADQQYAIGRGIAAIRGINGYPTPYVRAVIEQNLDRLLATATGSTFPNVGGGMLKNFDISTVGVEEAESISLFLVALEDKIELNRQINQTLEQIAQAIFKSWFVDFEPVKAKQHLRVLGGNDEQTERAAQAVIAGAVNLDAITTATDLSALDQQLTDALNEKLAHQTDAHREQLATTASHFPDQLVESELGLIPKGWEWVTIDDVCDFQNGYAFKSKEMTTDSRNAYKIFKMGNIQKGGGFNRKGSKDYYSKEKCEGLDRYLVKKGDLLMCMTDMKNNVALLGHTALMDADDEFILNQRVGLIRSKNCEMVNFPFLNILTNSQAFIEDLRSRANSGVQVNLSTKEIKSTRFLLPTKDVHEAFDRLCMNVSEKGFELGRQSEKLESCRDLMLPKLLSGELEVQKAA